MNVIIKFKIGIIVIYSDVDFLKINDCELSVIKDTENYTSDIRRVKEVTVDGKNVYSCKPRKRTGKPGKSCRF